MTRALTLVKTTMKKNFIDETSISQPCPRWLMGFALQRINSLAMNRRNKNSSFWAFARVDVVLFLSSFIFHGLAFRGSMGIQEYNRQSGIYWRAILMVTRPSTMVDKRLISDCAVAVWNCSIFLFIISPLSPLLIRGWWPTITDQSCQRYLWQRGSAVASCRARIKSRICFRGEGESDVGSLGIYGRLLVASLLRREARAQSAVREDQCCWLTDYSCGICHRTCRCLSSQKYGNFIFLPGIRIQKALEKRYA